MNQQNPFIYRALIKSIHDGDTITVDVDLGFKTWAHDLKVRLYGINAPELSTPSGKASRAWLANKLEGKAILLEAIKNRLLVDQVEKYGRWLGIVHLPTDTETINAQLIRYGLAAHAEY